jgi:streptogrisin D
MRDDAAVAGVIRRCTGIWFPGGEPYRITSVLYAAAKAAKGVEQSAMGKQSAAGAGAGAGAEAGAGAGEGKVDGSSPGGAAVGGGGYTRGGEQCGPKAAGGRGGSRGKAGAVLTAIAGRHVAGASVSGTSAGAMAFSTAPMVLGGRNYVAVRDPAVGLYKFTPLIHSSKAPGFNP